MRRRALVLAFALAVATVGLLVPTGSLTAGTMDRSVAVDVADHEHAVVAIWDPGGRSPEPPGYAGEDPVTGADDTTVVVVVENNFEATTVTVRVSAREDASVAVDGTPSVVPPGAVEPVDAAVDCGNETGRVTVPLTVHVVDDNGSVEMVVEYEASVVCADGKESGGGAGDGGNGGDGAADGGDADGPGEIAFGSAFHA